MWPWIEPLVKAEHNWYIGFMAVWSRLKTASCSVPCWIQSLVWAIVVNRGREISDREHAKMNNQWVLQLSPITAWVTSPIYVFHMPHPLSWDVLVQGHHHHCHCPCPCHHGHFDSQTSTFSMSPDANLVACHLQYWPHCQWNQLGNKLSAWALSWMITYQDHQPRPPPQYCPIQWQPPNPRKPSHCQGMPCTPTYSFNSLQYILWHYFDFIIWIWTSTQYSILLEVDETLLTWWSWRKREIMRKMSATTLGVTCHSSLSVCITQWLTSFSWFLSFFAITIMLL